MSLAASEIQIFTRMDCKMNDSSDALPAIACKMEPSISGETLSLQICHVQQCSNLFSIASGLQDFSAKIEGLGGASKDKVLGMKKTRR